jgi:hypothetical protein
LASSHNFLTIPDYAKVPAEVSTKQKEIENELFGPKRDELRLVRKSSLDVKHCII